MIQKALPFLAIDKLCVHIINFWCFGECWRKVEQWKNIANGTCCPLTSRLSVFWCLSGTFEESGWSVPMHKSKTSHQESIGDWKGAMPHYFRLFFSHCSQLERCGNAWYQSSYLAWRLCSALQRTAHDHAICVLTHPYCAHSGGFFETIKYTVNNVWEFNSYGINRHIKHQPSDLNTWF